MESALPPEPCGATDVDALPKDETALPRMYTPAMVLVAAALFAPLGGIYLLWANYRALGQREASVKTLYWSIVGYVLLLALSFALGKWWPQFKSDGLGVGIAVALASIAQSLQWRQVSHPWRTRDLPSISQAPPLGRPKSWWLGLLAGLLGLIFHVALAFGVAVVLAIAFPHWWFAH